MIQKAPLFVLNTTTTDTHTLACACMHREREDGGPDSICLKYWRLRRDRAPIQRSVLVTKGGETLCSDRGLTEGTTLTLRYSPVSDAFLCKRRFARRFVFLLLSYISLFAAIHLPFRLGKFIKQPLLVPLPPRAALTVWISRRVRSWSRMF